MLAVNPLISPLSDEIDGNEVKFQVGGTSPLRPPDRKKTCINDIFYYPPLTCCKEDISLIFQGEESRPMQKQVFYENVIFQ
jgi:hypothetical protein